LQKGKNHGASLHLNEFNNNKKYYLTKNSSSTEQSATT